MELDSNQVTALFEHMTGSTTGLGVPKAMFLAAMRSWYKVIRPTVQTETFSIKSPVTRRLDVGEIVELIDSPEKDESIGVSRIRCRTLRDGELGWVTISGNQGTVFLEAVSHYFICVRETSMSNCLNDSGQAVERMLMAGEIIELLEFTQKDGQEDALWMKGKVQGDNTIGWLSMTQPGGEAVLEKC